MGKANVFGASSGGNAFFDALLVDFDDDPTPVVSDVMPFEHYDGGSVQLVSGGARRIIVLTGDSVVASSHRFVLKSGNFTTSDEGGSFTLAGSSAGNDDVYTIDTVVNAFTVTTVEAPASNEVFDPDDVTVDLVQTSVFGTWDFRVSNSYSPGTTVATVNDGSPWTPIGDQFVPPIAAVAAQYTKDTASSANQFCNAAPLMAGAVQLRFTPTSGRGPISAWWTAKGNR